jgi:hypothetical protein
MFKIQLYTTLITLVHLCWTSQTFAQNYFNDTSTFDRASAIYSSVQTNATGDSIFVFGTVSDTTQFFRSNLLFRILTASHSQHFLYADTIKRVFFTKHSFLIPNGFAVTGTVPNKVISGTGNSFLLCVNKLGDSLLYREYSGMDTTSDLRVVDGVYYDNKFFLLCGNTRKYTSPFEYQIVLIIADSFGNLIHKKQYGMWQKEEYPGRILLMPNGNLVLGGVRSHVQSPIQNISFQTWIFEVDTAGNFIREYLAPLSKRAGVPANLAVTADGGLVYSTTTLTWPEDDTRLWRRGYVERLNSNWQVDVDTIFGAASPYMQQYDMQMLADESIVTCGYHYTGQDSIGRFYGWINKIAASGEHLWQRRYLPFFVPEYVDGEPVSMAKAPDGGFILAGQGRAYGSTLPKGQYAWLLKVDSMGCLVPGCAVSVQELTKEKVYLKVWPNPATDVLYILYKTKQPMPGAELRLTDMQGRIRQKTVIPEGFNSDTGELQYYLPLQDMEAGIYVLQLVYKGQLLAHEKVVVTR